MRGDRVQWEVAPGRGLLPWELTREGRHVKSYLFQSWAIEDAVTTANYELDEFHMEGQLTVTGRDGQMKARKFFGNDPKETS